MQVNKQVESVEMEIYNVLTHMLTNRVVRIGGCECESYIIRFEGMIGVAIPYLSDSVYYESFNNMELKNKTFIIDEKSTNCLVLVTKSKRYFREFSKLCADFVIGDKKRRNLIVNDPSEWWSTWKELLGNKYIDIQIYSLIAELLIYHNIYSKDATAIWKYNDYKTHDIETETKNYEVKSTLKKYTSIIHVNSEFQLQNFTNSTFMFFVRMEQSLDGVSLEDVINRFDQKKRSDINEMLSKSNVAIPTHQRIKKFKILEVREYAIDDYFPLLRLDLCAIPINVYHINYELSLDGIEYRKVVLK